MSLEKITKKDYFNLVMGLSVNQIKWCLANPTEHMKNIHILLLRLALREKSADESLKIKT